MRPGQQNKRGRGRNNNGGGSNNGGGGSNNNNNNNNNHNRKGSNPLTRTYDSSGPDVKIRGTAQHIAEKYGTLARDAQSSGDRVVAENYLQHAEHYNRIIASAQAQMQERFQRDDRNDYNDRDGNERDGQDQDDLDQNDGDDNAPQMDHQPRHQPQQRSRQPQNNQPIQPQPESAQAEQPEPVAQPEQREPREPREQPVRQRRERQPRPVQDSQPVTDGSGPQPVIEGTPAEVSLEDEAPVEGARTPARRRGAPRPRRQPRRGDGAETASGEGDAPAGDAPALVDAAGE